MGLSLLSIPTRVETPFIIATIGGYTFGNYSWRQGDVTDSQGYRQVLSKFPNYMTSLTIEKVNGTVNSYTLNMVYAIHEGDDPNLLEKIFSKAKQDRRITLSYGDLSLPSYIYKEEEAMITDIKSNIDINSSVIRYTITCVSSVLLLASGTYPFEAKVVKPSDEIKRLLYDSTYNITQIFYGMQDKEKVMSAGLIIGDDKPVLLEAKPNISVFDYLDYLVKCMVCIDDNDNSLKRKFRYSLLIKDDFTNKWGGPYFEVIKTSTDINDNTLDAYEVNVGYPGENMVMNFTLDDNRVWSILYDYSDNIRLEENIFRINSQGEIIGEYSPRIALSDVELRTTPTEEAYWSILTQYPITGTLTIKGLLRPAILMSYIKLDVLFFGRKHISSGYYIVTKQTDTIDSSGYRTTLKISRVKGSKLV